MKKLIFSVMASLVVGLVFAGQIELKVLTLNAVVTNAATPVQTNCETIRGFLEDITIDVSTATATGTIQVLLSSQSYSLPSVVLATNANLAADKRFIPRFDSTDVAGNPVTNAWGRFPICGDSIIFKLSNANLTTAVFRAVIKYEKE